MTYSRHVTDDIRTQMYELLRLSGVQQKEIAEAVGKQKQQVNQALRGNLGNLPPIWQDILYATGMKIVIVPENSNFDMLAAIRERAEELKTLPEDTRLNKRGS